MERLRAEVQELHSENAELRKRNIKLTDGLQRCISFMTQFVQSQVEEAEAGEEDPTLVPRLMKENEMLRAALDKDVASAVPQNVHAKTKTKHVSPLREVESEGEESSSSPRNSTVMDTAVKLLVIKYSFEKARRTKRRHGAAKEDKRAVAGGTVSMKDRMKEFGNLKPKQQFIMMQEEDKESTNNRKDEAPAEAGGENKNEEKHMLAIDEMSGFDPKSHPMAGAESPADG